MRVRYGTTVGKCVGFLLTGVGMMGLVVGCEDPDIVQVGPPGVSLPKQSPDAEPAAAKGEMPAAISLESATPAAKSEDYAPAPPTAKGETKTTKRGVKYETLKEGNGPELKFGQTGAFFYVGKLEDGTMFDGNREAGKPSDFTIGPLVIEGWREGLPGMKVGETRKITIPPVLGYGAKGFPPKIPADATLIFEVELAGIKGQ